MLYLVHHATPIALLKGVSTFVKTVRSDLENLRSAVSDLEKCVSHELERCKKLYF